MGTVHLIFVKDDCPSSAEYVSFEAAVEDACYFGFQCGEFMPTRIVDGQDNELADIYKLRSLYRAWKDARKG